MCAWNEQLSTVSPLIRMTEWIIRIGFHPARALSNLPSPIWLGGALCQRHLQRPDLSSISRRHSVSGGHASLNLGALARDSRNSRYLNRVLVVSFNGRPNKTQGVFRGEFTGRDRGSWCQETTCGRQWSVEKRRTQMNTPARKAGFVGWETIVSSTPPHLS